jgi:hypothetical protein
VSEGRDVPDDGERRVGEEAARLLSAAQDWLRTSAPHLAPVGVDGEPCSCPLCRVVVGLRDADPESVARWVDTAVAAASSALAQAGDLLGAPGVPGTDASADPEGSSAAPTDTGDESGQDGPRPRGVRRIPLERETPAGGS